ncbi:MAG: ABC transporter permease [Planctomycetota bacterium]
MALPLNYSLRNIAVRRASTLLTALGIAMTVAVFAGIFSLHNGFHQLYRPRGSKNLGIYMRPGATSEGESLLGRALTEILIKERPEVSRDGEGRPLAAAEMFLAVYMKKTTGGVTNVPLRGIQPASLKIHEEGLKLVDGRWLNFGSDEIVVGEPLTERMRDCRIGDTLRLNMTPFKVVGVFRHDGAYGSEVWGDADRMMRALDRSFFQRVVAQVQPDTEFTVLDEELRSDPRTPVKLLSEREYLEQQTNAFGIGLKVLAGFLTVIMGIAAVLGAMNTMIASVASRTHEIGVLLAIGFQRRSIFLTFLVESALVGLIGGALGLLLVLPFNGIETGAMNWNTFTDVTFAFQLSPALVGMSFTLAFLLGLIGGVLPAVRAAMLKPIDALRQV